MDGKQILSIDIEHIWHQNKRIKKQTRFSSRDYDITNNQYEN